MTTISPYSTYQQMHRVFMQKIEPLLPCLVSSKLPIPTGKMSDISVFLDGATSKNSGKEYVA